MKSGTAGVAVLVSALALSSVAVAQSAGQPTNRPPPGPIGRMTQQQESWRFESEEMRRQNSMTPEEAEAEYGAERMELARRVAELVEQGKCREARTLANEAGERQMALRVRQTCQSR
ncbi:hypothetical protein [Brevundimonas sp.]|uniref:hypothetical protein n=1 Tax=Brevundimonas sp. TaxID=1871086 RepID=UPI002D60EB78|nr:hypothetical protein [Brevundimonas sp.]HYC99221.1 hypothetical protein [Brevundimonas sp.]